MKDYVTEAEAFNAQHEGATDKRTERQKMLEWHGYDECDDLSHLSGNDYRRMWWSYRNCRVPELEDGK